MTDSVSGVHGPGCGGFWIRLVAHIIDQVPLLAPVTVFALQAPGEAAVLLGLVAHFLHCTVCHSSGWRAAVGKRVCGLKAVDGQGARISMGTAAFRWLATALSWLTLCVGYPMVAWTERKRGLHDMIAGTLVVKAETTGGAS